MADRRAAPALSLIVPVYGVEDYIGDCLDSILNALGFADLCELVVVDDGSLDASMSIVERRCEGLPNVTIIRQANTGLGGARNTGLSHARGRYVWFIDSDDEICSNSIRILSECIERSSSDIIAFEFETIGGTLKRAPYLAAYNHPVDPIDFLTSGRPPSPVQFYAFSLAMLRSAGLLFHKDIYHEDALFTALAMTKSKGLVRLRETLYRYRLRAGSIMAVSRPDKHLTDMLYIADCFSAQAKSYPPGSRFRKALGREIGFAMSAARFYASKTPHRARHSIAPPLRLTSLGRQWSRYFTVRSLLQFSRFLANAVVDSARARI